MISVRTLFGFVLVALALYFLGPLRPPRLTGPAVAVPLAVGAIWFAAFDRTGGGSGWFRVLRTAFAVGLLVSSVIFALPRKEPKTEIRFTPYSETALQAAARDGRPVLIDFFATWCLPCKELDEKTFSDARVAAAAEGWVCLKADMTKSSDENLALTTRWGVKGMPTIVFLGPDGKERPGRVVGFEPPEQFVSHLAR
jgi:thiol:disulfide interchange protein DsbD